MEISFSAWFWLLIIAIIGLIIFLILFETQAVDMGWAWFVFSISLIFLIIAFILYIVALKDIYINPCIDPCQPVEICQPCETSKPICRDPCATRACGFTVL